MDPNHWARQIEHLTGRPGTPSPSVVRPDFDSCAQLVTLVLTTEPRPEIRREPWERRPQALTLVVGNDLGLSLGLDFPGGVADGPTGGWIRSRTATGAVHWRLARRQAEWILDLLKCALARREPTAPQRP